MDAKLKAEKLVEKYQNVNQPEGYDCIAESTAIECAKIAVDEIIKIQVLRSTIIASKIDGYLESDSSEYWQEVKNELNKM